MSDTQQQDEKHEESDVPSGRPIVRETAEQALENDRCGICLSADHFREDHPDTEQPESDTEQDPVPVDPNLPGLVALREVNARIEAGQDVTAQPALAAADVETYPRPMEDYSDATAWDRGRLVAELARTKGDLSHVQGMVDRLSTWIMDTVPQEITPERGDVDAVSIAIRLLTAWINNPNGRLEQPVRDALDRLDQLPGVDADEIRAQVEVARNHLAIALTDPPRPRCGQGEAPTLESDDITVVRYDRDRFRVELDLAYKTIAEMFAAGTGHRNGPQRGVVEDLADMYARKLAAEQALAFALAGRGDNGYPVPAKGTPAYDTWAALVLDVVATIADTKLKVEVVGGAGMPVAGQRAS